MKALKQDNKMAWGIGLLVFGLLFLIKQLNIIPAEAADLIFDFKNYPLILGVIFLIVHSNKNIGWVLVAVGLLFRLQDIIRITRHISDFVWPVLLIAAGIILIINKNNKK